MRYYINKTNTTIAAKPIKANHIHLINSAIKNKNTKPVRRTPIEKCSCAVSYMPMDFDTSSTIKTPGKPDIACPTVRRGFTKLQTVIFVRGCFWNGHEGCKYYVVSFTLPDIITSLFFRL